MSPEDRLDELEEALEEHLEDFEDCQWERALSQVTLTIPRERLIEVMKLLREKRALAFEQCIDVCGVDYEDRDQRLEVVYHLTSLEKDHLVLSEIHTGLEFMHLADRMRYVKASLVVVIMPVAPYPMIAVRIEKTFAGVLAAAQGV